MIEYIKQNLKNINFYLAIFLPIFYFCISWQVNWMELTPEGWSISVSYFFDICFALSILAFGTKRNFLGTIIKRNLAIRMVLVIGVALLCVTILYMSEMLNSPFKHVDNLFLQMLILAPIVEELVFRGAIYELFKLANVRIWANNLINSTLFAASHAAGFFVLPKEFFPFLIFQMQYTFVLGHLCTKSRERTHGVLEPIILHLAFNLIFYASVKLQLI